MYIELKTFTGSFLHLQEVLPSFSPLIKKIAAFAVLLFAAIIALRGILKVINNVAKPFQKPIVEAELTENLHKKSSSEDFKKIDNLKGQQNIPNFTQVNLPIYGAEAWKSLGVEIVEKISPVPSINWDEIDPFTSVACKNFVEQELGLKHIENVKDQTLKTTSELMYIPEGIIVNGKQEKITLNTLLKLFTLKYGSVIDVDCFTDIHNQYGIAVIPSGWILVRKECIGFRSAYSQQKKILKHLHYEMSGLGELLIVNLLRDFSQSKTSLVRTGAIFCKEEVNGLWGPYSITRCNASVVSGTKPVYTLLATDLTSGDYESCPVKRVF